LQTFSKAMSVRMDVIERAKRREDGYERSLHANRLRALHLVGRTSAAFMDKLTINFPTRCRRSRRASVIERVGKQRVVAGFPRRSSGGSRHANSKLAGTADVLHFLNEHAADYTRCTGAAEQLHQLKAIY
jgi:hypothetical protein